MTKGPISDTMFQKEWAGSIRLSKTLDAYCILHSAAYGLEMGSNIVCEGTIIHYKYGVVSNCTNIKAYNKVVCSSFRSRPNEERVERDRS